MNSSHRVLALCVEVPVIQIPVTLHVVSNRIYLPAVFRVYGP